jgi:hypothetical protein
MEMSGQLQVPAALPPETVSRQSGFNLRAVYVACVVEKVPMEQVSLTLKMRAVWSSEALVSYHITARHQNLDDHDLKNILSERFVFH